LKNNPSIIDNSINNDFNNKNVFARLDECSSKPDSPYTNANDILRGFDNYMKIDKFYLTYFKIKVEFDKSKDYSKDEMLSGLLSVFYRGIETESRKNKIDSVIPAFMNSLEFKSGFSKISYENYKAEIQKKNIQRELETEEKPTSSKVIPKEQINQPQVVNLVKGLKDCDECPEMAVLPAGSFLMGSPPDPEPDPFSNVEPVKIAENSEMPQHRVNIKSFLIGKYEVTQEQWYAVMGNNPSLNKGSTLPVGYVSWDDVQLFLHNLIKKTELRLIFYYNSYYNLIRKGRKHSQTEV
jgi:hypothetical protein